MDQLSYYCTIGSALIIKIAYYLLFRADKRAEKFTYHQVKSEQFAIVLVGSQVEANSALVSQLKTRLNKLGFSTYQICTFNSRLAAADKQDDESKQEEKEDEKNLKVNELISSDENNDDDDNNQLIWVDFGAGKNEQLGSSSSSKMVAKLIEAKLSSKKQQLYAYINLSASISQLSTSASSSSLTSSSSSSTLSEQILPSIGSQLIPSLSLLACFAELIQRDQARVINVHQVAGVVASGGNRNREKAASGLIKKLADCLSEGVEQFLFMGQNVLSIEILEQKSQHANANAHHQDLKVDSCNEIFRDFFLTNGQLNFNQASLNLGRIIKRFLKLCSPIEHYPGEKNAHDANEIHELEKSTLISTNESSLDGQRDLLNTQRLVETLISTVMLKYPKKRWTVVI